MQADARTDHTDCTDRAALAALIADATPQLAALAAAEAEAYAPLRQALAMLPRAELPEELALALRIHLEEHCRGCGAALPALSWYQQRICWCKACREGLPVESERKTRIIGSVYVRS